MKEVKIKIPDGYELKRVSDNRYEVIKSIEWIDLGLPSGRLWAKENEDGYYNFNEAVNKFGNNLPKSSHYWELYKECEWKWNDERKGYDVVAKNGNSIFFPAAGYRYNSTGNLGDVGVFGFYWQAVPYNVNCGRNLYFNSSNLNPANTSDRSFGFSVRLITESKLR